MGKRLFFAFLILLFPLYVWADTHNAASCSVADINTAIAAAADGDTVSVPNTGGGCTWTGGLNSITKAIKLVGAPTNITLDNFAEVAIPFNTNTAGLEISQFNFTGGTSGVPSIRIYGTPSTFRIHHNTFTGTNYSIIDIGQQGISSMRAFGLIDSNTFTNVWMVLRVFADDIDDFDRADSFGTVNAVFFENNIVNTATNDDWLDRIFFDGDYGGRTVIRYNDITNTQIHSHGDGDGEYGGPADDRASIRHYEINNNLFTKTGFNEAHSYGNRAVSFIHLRGGTGYIYHNKFVSETASGGNEALTGHIATAIVTTVVYRGDVASSGSCELEVGCYGGNAFDGNENFASGTATGTSGTVLTVSGTPFGSINFTGYQIFNTTDGSRCKVTSNTNNSITCSGGLAGGSDNTWTNGDSYAIRTGWPCHQQVGRGQRTSEGPPNETYASVPVLLWGNDRTQCTYGGCDTWVHYSDPDLGGTCLASVSHSIGDRTATFPSLVNDWTLAAETSRVQDDSIRPSGYGTGYYCPHPLAGLTGKTCNPNLAGAGTIGGYGVSSRIYGPLRIYMK